MQELTQPAARKAPKPELQNRQSAGPDAPDLNKEHSPAQSPQTAAATLPPANSPPPHRSMPATSPPSTPAPPAAHGSRPAPSAPPTPVSLKRRAPSANSLHWRRQSPSQPTPCQITPTPSRARPASAYPAKTLPSGASVCGYPPESASATLETMAPSPAVPAPPSRLVSVAQRCAWDCHNLRSPCDPQLHPPGTDRPHPHSPGAASRNPSAAPQPPALAGHRC